MIIGNCVLPHDPPQEILFRTDARIVFSLWHVENSVFIRVDEVALKEALDLRPPDNHPLRYSQFDS